MDCGIFDTGWERRDQFFSALRGGARFSQRGERRFYDPSRPPSAGKRWRRPCEGRCAPVSGGRTQNFLFFPIKITSGDPPSAFRALCRIPAGALGAEPKTQKNTRGTGRKRSWGSILGSLTRGAPRVGRGGIGFSLSCREVLAKERVFSLHGERRFFDPSRPPSGRVTGRRWRRPCEGDARGGARG